MFLHSAILMNYFIPPPSYLRDGKTMCMGVSYVASNVLLTTPAATKNDPHLYNSDPNLVCRCIITQQMKLQTKGWFFIYGETDSASRLAATNCSMWLRDA